MAVAVRIARASVKRDLVLFSGYHGWADWYLSANIGETDALDGDLMPGLEPAGVPRGLRGSAIPFTAGDIYKLKSQIRGREKEVAAIVIEPARGEDAPPGYLKALRELASEIGAILIFDEITSGFRMNVGGIHLRYGINPDIAVFAKSMANGYAISAVIGREKVMQAAQSTFISSTNWTERVGPTAALATIKKYQRENVAEHICGIGSKVKEVWTSHASKHHLPLKVSGLPSLAAFTFDSEHAREMNTYFTVAMLQRGFLGFRQFKPSLAHTDEDVRRYDEAVDVIFAELASRKPDSLLDTPAAHSGFFRLTKE
jgi:glutamate-1-semialdehyde 2,1-aminomutase